MFTDTTQRGTVTSHLLRRFRAAVTPNPPSRNVVAEVLDSPTREQCDRNDPPAKQLMSAQGRIAPNDQRGGPEIAGGVPEPSAGRSEKLLEGRSPQRPHAEVTEHIERIGGDTSQRAPAGMAHALENDERRTAALGPHHLVLGAVRVRQIQGIAERLECSLKAGPFLSRQLVHVAAKLAKNVVNLALRQASQRDAHLCEVTVDVRLGAG